MDARSGSFRLETAFNTGAQSLAEDRANSERLLFNEKQIQLLSQHQYLWCDCEDRPSTIFSDTAAAGQSVTLVTARSKLGLC